MNDYTIIRALALRVREISCERQYAEKRAKWAAHNTLTGDKSPLLWICPDGDGGWKDLIPEAELRTADPELRELEEQLLRLLFHHEHFDDDFVIEPLVRFEMPGEYTGYTYASATQKSAWGIPIAPLAVSQQAYHMDDYLSDPRHVELLLQHEVDFVCDEEALARRREKFEEAVGGAVDIHFTLPYVVLVQSLLIELVHLCGLTTLMTGLYDDPEGFHAILDHMSASKNRLLLKLEKEKKLFDNRSNIYTGSGGLGYTGDAALPPEEVTLRHMWGFADAQEFSSVSPAMFKEFAIDYQKRGLSQFGYACYGCCEPLDNKFDMIFAALPNIRRLSVSPWSDIDVAAQAIGNRAIYSWKPNPSLVCTDFAREEMEAQMRRLRAATSGQCFTEAILKDIRTCKLENLKEFAALYKNVMY